MQDGNRPTDDLQALDGLFKNAIKALRELQKRNAELSTALQESNSKIASYESTVATRFTSLEQENRQLAAELEDSRRRFISFQETATRAIAGLQAKNQQLAENLNATNRKVLLYEGLSDLIERYRTSDLSKNGAQPDINALTAIPELRVAPPPQREVRQPAVPSRPPARDMETADANNIALNIDLLEGEFEAVKYGLLRQASGQPTSIEALQTDVSLFGDNSSGSLGEPPLMPSPQESGIASFVPAEPVAAMEPPQRPSAADMGVVVPFQPRPGEVELIVSPFTHFDGINKFTTAVRTLPGVTSAKARHFQKGTLHLLVGYDSVIPIFDRLRELVGFDLRIDEANAQRIQATLQPLEGGTATSRSEIRR